MMTFSEMGYHDNGLALLHIFLPLFFSFTWLSLDLIAGSASCLLLVFTCAFSE